MQKHHSLRLKKNYYPHFVMGFLVFMGSLVVSGLVASVFAPVSESSAQTINVAFDNPGYYLSVTSADSIDLALSATLAGQVAVSDASTVTVKTNAPLGYKLYLSTEDDELRAADTDKTFKPVTTTALTLNTWGFSKTGTDNSWLAVPEVTSGNESSGYLLASKDGPSAADGDNTDIYYGINGSITMPAGNYSTTVTYTAIGDGIPEEHTMQEFTMAECVNMPVDKTFYLIDSRNNKIYSIVHAKDGNCWMTQNLSIYNQQISSADSNLPEGTTITLPGSTNWNTNDYTNMRIHVGTNTGYVGEVYYNWCASLGKANCSEGANVTVNQSICPKGWRLPINGGTTQNKSYAKLMNAYSVTASTQLINPDDPAYILGFHRYYGLWHYGHNSEDGRDINSYFLSSTAMSGTRVYFLRQNSTAINPQDNLEKGYGFSIRCVYDAPTMQEFSATDCANINTDTQFTLTDSRNYKEYKIVKARDGNCWMADNLAIYNQTISSADSDLPSGTTITLPSSSTWRGNNYSAMLIHVTDGTGQYADKTGAYNGEVQYNWCAILGKSTCGEDTNVTVNQSICPKGWRLPVDGDTSTDKSWAKLMDIYNIQTGADLVNATSSQAAYSLGFHRYYGYWNHYYFSEHSQGEVGDFWSSTAYSNAANAYILLSDNTTINPHHKGDKGAGHNARCVLK